MAAVAAAADAVKAAVLSEAETVSYFTLSYTAGITAKQAKE